MNNKDENDKVSAPAKMLYSPGEKNKESGDHPVQKSVVDGDKTPGGLSGDHALSGSESQQQDLRKRKQINVIT